MHFTSTCMFVLIAACFVSIRGLDKLKNTSGHEIIDGNCTNPSIIDRVYYDHVDKMAFPLIIRSETVKYYGDKVIYCIAALNQKNNDTGGTSTITDGGVGHQYVVIELESFRSHGLEFYVSIFAKNSSKVTNGNLIPPLIQQLSNNSN